MRPFRWLYICRRPTILLYWRLSVQAVPSEEVLLSCWPAPRNLLGLSCFSLFNHFLMLLHFQYFSTNVYFCPLSWYLKSWYISIVRLRRLSTFSTRVPRPTCLAPNMSSIPWRAPSSDYGLGDLFAYLHNTLCVSADNSAIRNSTTTRSEPRNPTELHWLYRRNLLPVRRDLPKTDSVVPTKSAAFRVIVERTLIMKIWYFVWLK